MNDDPLKLLAQDDQDVQVLAAVLQDAIAPVSEMQFLAAEKNFVMIVHRFRWDRAPEPIERPDVPQPYERINCAFDVRGVESVQFLGFDPKEQSTMLDLLTMLWEDGFLRLVFAGGAQIRLKLGTWQVRLTDFGESWPTSRKPRHST